MINSRSIYQPGLIDITYRIHYLKSGGHGGHAEDDDENKQTLVNTSSTPGAALVPPECLWHRYNVISIFRVEETEAQRCEVSCPRRIR